MQRALDILSKVGGTLTIPELSVIAGRNKVITKESHIASAMGAVNQELEKPIFKVKFVKLQVGNRQFRLPSRRN